MRQIRESEVRAITPFRVDTLCAQELRCVKIDFTLKVGGGSFRDNKCVN